MNSAIQAVRSIASVIAGYATIVVAALIFQDVIFGGLSYPQSPLADIAIGGGFTVLGAVAGGYVLAALCRKAPLHHAAVLAGWLLFEGVYLFVAGISASPLWFDVISSASLAVGVILGCSIFMRRMPSVAAR
jgi:hypothetical protein